MSKLSVLWALLMVVCWSASSAQNRRANEKPEEEIYLFGGTGNDLLERCSHPEVKAGDVMTVQEIVKTAKDNGMCVGYIVGVSDQALGDRLSRNTKRSYCLAAEVRSEQLVMVVRKYLENNPALLHLPAGALTARALSEAFPCH